MPFQSEKQRRYLHANHPEIAKRWEREYATGGISNHFKLKDGGNIRLQPHTATDLLVKKNPDGTRSKYQPPGGGATSLGSGRDYSGSDRGPRDDPDRFGPPVIQPSPQPVRHPAVDTPEQIEEQRIIDRNKLARIGSEDDELVGWHPAAEEKANKMREEQIFKVLRRKDLTKDQKERQLKYIWEETKKAHKTVKRLQNAMAIHPVVGILAALFMGNKAKKEREAEISKLEEQMGSLEDWGLKTRHPAVDTPYQILEQRILDLTQRPRPEEGEGRESPESIYVPLTGAVDEEYAQGYYGMSDLERIRAGQAKRAMLVQKGIIQDNPIVDESITDITMQANSGGLANLFRVKNQ